MPESKPEKAGRLQKLREKRHAKRAQPTDTPEAVAERAKRGKEYDEDALRKLGERTGVYQ